MSGSFKEGSRVTPKAGYGVAGKGYTVETVRGNMVTAVAAGGGREEFHKTKLEKMDALAKGAVEYSERLDALEKRMGAAFGRPAMTVEEEKAAEKKLEEVYAKMPKLSHREEYKLAYGYYPKRGG